MSKDRLNWARWKNRFPEKYSNHNLNSKLFFIVAIYWVYTIIELKLSNGSTMYGVVIGHEFRLFSKRVEVVGTKAVPKGPIPILLSTC